MFEGHDITCKRGERQVFNDLNFQLAQGQALVLRGPNGSGKTSFLRIAAGLLKPVGGRLAWNGADISVDPEAHFSRLHYVGHQDAVKDALTVRENITTISKIRGYRDNKVEGAMVAFNIDKLAETQTRYLSAGQRRRIALARIVAAPATLWLLDEPTISLDADGSNCLQKAMEGHCASGGMVIAATHIELGLKTTEVLRLNI